MMEKHHLPSEETSRSGDDENNGHVFTITGDKVFNISTDTSQQWSSPADVYHADNYADGLVGDQDLADWEREISENQAEPHTPREAAYHLVWVENSDTDSDPDNNSRQSRVDENSVPGYVNHTANDINPRLGRDGVAAPLESIAVINSSEVNLADHNSSGELEKSNADDPALSEGGQIGVEQLEINPEHFKANTEQQMQNTTVESRAEASAVRVVVSDSPPVARRDAASAHGSKSSVATGIGNMDADKSPNTNNGGPLSDSTAYNSQSSQTDKEHPAGPKLNATSDRVQIRALTTLRDGRAVWVRGRIDSRAREFSFSIQTGPTQPPECDSYFYCQPVLHDSVIIQNACMYRTWGVNEVVNMDKLKERSIDKFPFRQDQIFDMKITQKADRFVVEVDDVIVTEFLRISPQGGATHLRMEGDVYLETIECPHKSVLPRLEPTVGGLRDGHSIVLDLNVLPHTRSFTIQIVAQNKKVYQVLSIATTFKDKLTEVVINAVENKKKREPLVIDGYLPIYQNMNLVLRIDIKAKDIDIFVNEDDFATFTHNLPLGAFTHVVLDGDVSLYALEVLRPRGKALPMKKVCPCCEGCTIQ